MGKELVFVLEEDFDRRGVTSHCGCSNKSSRIKKSMSTVFRPYLIAIVLIYLSDKTTNWSFRIGLPTVAHRILFYLKKEKKEEG